MPEPVDNAVEAILRRDMEALFAALPEGLRAALAAVVARELGYTLPAEKE